MQAGAQGNDKTRKGPGSSAGPVSFSAILSFGHAHLVGPCSGFPHSLRLLLMLVYLNSPGMAAVGVVVSAP